MLPPETLVVDREHLVAALRSDLVGPFVAGPAGATELLTLPPSRWYLTGFLVPPASRVTTAIADDPTNDEELAAGADQDDLSESAAEPEQKQRQFFPSSMGLSVLLPPGAASDVVAVTVGFAEYVVEKNEDKATGRPRTDWRRRPFKPVTVEVPLSPELLAKGIQVAGADGVLLIGQLGTTQGSGLAPQTRALSLFLLNNREAVEDHADTRFLFQVGLDLHAPMGITPRPDHRDESSDDWDERVADLQYRAKCEWAVGHGVAVEVPPQDGPVTRVRTTWIPRAEVKKVRTRDETKTVVDMETLAELSDPGAIRAALTPIVTEYSAWLDDRAKVDPGSALRRQTRDQLLAKARLARDRIASGIETLVTDPEALEAFRHANRAMAMSALQRSPERYVTKRPAWHLFQLAFLLTNVEPTVNPRSKNRDKVELIFFPTGGGKTEAYLGVIAFTLVLRRLRGQARPDAGLGVAVLLRYTLRLLTLDQLSRAATLMCALELIRRSDPKRLGEARFAVGLWVGRTATANTLAEVSDKITNYKNSTSENAPSPFPLAACPWCQKPLDKRSLNLKPDRTNPIEVVAACAQFQCDFAAAKSPEGLPVLFVDEQIYRELPSFIVATVDKFAMLPWRGETGMLFGRASARDGRRFFGPMDPKPHDGSPLPDGLLPPELIVQDELHLISGPLGTMVGLYETAIETLCTREEPGQPGVKPRILAATATVRRADAQIRALFGRSDPAQFPPPFLDDSETFFAEVDHDAPGRLYVGVAAPGRPLKAILRRTYTALLTAAAKRYDKRAGEHQTADGYMTLAGYFNSLRELGGMRRLVDDEVRTYSEKAENRRPRDFTGPHPWVRNRSLEKEVVELTSRESTSRIAEAKARLLETYGKNHVDVLLASNMISVGVDINRLGLMVIAGQPKTTSEYIQASSRVGRTAQHPGLVVTCFNVTRPRDRSHFERFTAYHESFYRSVEAMSLTPFAEPALRRGFAGTLVAMARLATPVLTHPANARQLKTIRTEVSRFSKVLAERGSLQPDVVGDNMASHERAQKLASRAESLLDAWQNLVAVTAEAAGERSYSRYDKVKGAGKPILYTVLDPSPPEPGSDDARFAAPTSMRDVEPTVHLWLRKTKLGGGAS